MSAWNKSVWLTQEALSDAKFVNQDKMQRQLDALRELYDAVIILDRAAEVQDPPLSVEIMRGQVDVLRQDACHVLNGMAEERRAGRRVDSIDATLEKLRSALEAEGPASLEHEVHSAVAFGLREVRCTLAALIECRNDVAG